MVPRSSSDTNIDAGNLLKSHRTREEVGLQVNWKDEEQFTSSNSEKQETERKVERIVERNSVNFLCISSHVLQLVFIH